MSSPMPTYQVSCVEGYVEEGGVEVETDEEGDMKAGDDEGDALMRGML